MKYLFGLILFYAINSNSQTKTWSLNEEYAKKELKTALLKSGWDNRINDKSNILNDSITAIKIAEIVLINVYGKEHIENQKPFKVCFVDKHWVMTGSNKEDGTFLIIIDAKNSKIVKISHDE